MYAQLQPPMKNVRVEILGLKILIFLHNFYCVLFFFLILVCSCEHDLFFTYNMPRHYEGLWLAESCDSCKNKDFLGSLFDFMVNFRQPFIHLKKKKKKKL